jgi:small membrane protein
MIAQFILSFLLIAILVYAGTQWRRSRFVAALAVLSALAGAYLVWAPEQASRVAQWVGIGRGADLILYVWVVISLLIMLNLHLKMRLQTELITTLARSIALDRAAQRLATGETKRL